jgi:hypothetical protein
LILWHSGERNWSAEMRALLQQLAEQRATLSKGPSSDEALQVLARRPEPRLLALLDSRGVHLRVVRDYLVKKGTNLVGEFRHEGQDSVAFCKLDSDGQATLNFGKETIYGTWKVDEDGKGDLVTPFGTHSVSLNLGDALEVREKRYQPKPEYTLPRVKNHPPEAAEQETALATLPEGATTVKYVMQKLTMPPKATGDWSGIQYADFSDNRLMALPPEILRGSSLQVLYARDNWLRDLPIEAPLTQLITLELGGNGFTAATPWLVRCPRLKRLGLSQNRLAKFPEGLAKLASLEVLDLSGNNLTEIPAEVLSRLPALRELRVGANQIRQVATQVLQTKLQLLDLSGNALDFESLRGPISIEKIDISGNGFTPAETASLERRYPKTKWFRGCVR